VTSNRNAGRLQSKSASSGGHGGQLDDQIIAQQCDGFQGHITGPLDRPFIVLLEQDRADEAGEGILVGEDADDLALMFAFKGSDAIIYLRCSGRGELIS
jgi:hypothetical protein